ncbi:hypothetical protein [Zhenhengia yiwuensis]|uniref:Uncharacterized protein n=1 Tax=Zhenhengia yiwuensis TaxID=2763666 RepID=A0A926EF18_9FIRM|nr:hypothetical protein [Zhenhengia yiwuensis]MBC8579118.1 hypothetical protein [Zhenhengia yiwuensis]
MTALKVGLLKIAYYTLAIVKVLTVFYYIGVCGGFENGTYTGLEFIINTILTFIILIVL